MRNILRILLFPIPVFLFPSVVTAQAAFEEERCFQQRTDNLRSDVILRFDDGQVTGFEVGNAVANTGETWGYQAQLEGRQTGAVLNLTRQILVEGDVQTDTVAWELSDDALRFDKGLFRHHDCERSWDEYHAAWREHALINESSDLQVGRILVFPYEYEGWEARPHELGFTLPHDGVARAEFASEPFYAIILKSAPRCQLTEAERLEIQNLFRSNKVFMDRFQCGEDPIEEALSYTNVKADIGFIAVHAGPAFADAELLMTNRSLEDLFPGANIRQMQVVLNYP